MKQYSKWLSGLAAVALLGLTVPVAYADGMAETEDTQETLVPADELDTQETEMETQETPEAVVPGSDWESEAQPEGEVNEDIVTEDDLYEEGEVQEEVVPEGRDTIIVAQPRAGAEPLDNFILEVGGGASTYSSELGDTLQGGAGWTARGIIGARSIVGGELAYFGAVNPLENTDVEDFGDFGDIDTDNSVFSNSAEALARVNFMGARSPVKPFVAGGANYTRFDSNAALDNIEAFAFPLAAGVQFYPMDNFTIGARGEYRILTDWIDDLPDGNQWGGNLTVGANF